jgi:quinol monooxygenase YgiN
MSEHPISVFIRSQLEDPTRPFTILATLEAQAGKGAALAAAITTSGVIDLTRAEAGCLAYDISRDAAAPDRFVAYESWRDLAALDGHLASPHFAAVGVLIGGLLAGSPAIRVLTPLAGEARR